MVLGDAKDPADFFQEGIVCPWAIPHLDMMHLRAYTGDCQPDCCAGLQRM